MPTVSGTGSKGKPAGDAATLRCFSRDNSRRRLTVGLATIRWGKRPHLFDPCGPTNNGAAPVLPFAPTPRALAAAALSTMNPRPERVGYAVTFAQARVAELVAAG
jgi:hypothetical protein